MSAAGMTATVIATELALAVQKDMEGDGCDVSAGMYGPAASAYIRELAQVMTTDKAAAPVGAVPQGDRSVELALAVILDQSQRCELFGMGGMAANLAEAHEALQAALASQAARMGESEQALLRMSFQGQKQMALAKDWREHFVSVSAMRYMDNGMDHDDAHKAAEKDADAIDKLRGEAG